MIAGTYEIKNKLDGMAYGGSSGEIEQRWKNHRWMLRKGGHHCAHLQNAWNKYGEDVFEFRVLEIIEDPVERIAAEQIWLDIHHAAGTCYNVAITAGPAGPRAEETKQKIRAGLMGNQNAKGHICTEEQKREHSERVMGNQNWVGRKHTDAARQQIGDANAKLYPAFIHRDTGEAIPAGVNLRCMCRERGLSKSCMCDVKNGKRPHHKGWMLLSDHGGNQA